VNVLYGTQIDDNHPNAPLLPPDEIEQNGILHKLYDIKDARKWYNCLKTCDSQFKRSRRKYLNGSFHNTCFGEYEYTKVDYESDGKTDIIVRLSEGSNTTIKVRQADSSLTDSIKVLNLRLKSEKSNCRGKKCGDNGSMYGLGEKGDDEFSLSKNNEDIQQMMATIGEKCSTWYRKEFHDEFLEMEQLKKDYDSLDYMTDSPSPFVIVSQNLSNSSHYDIGDEVNSITTWTEETLGNTLNWKFVFPNVSINNNPGKALVIILSDGLTISWNGALLRHGSSRTNERVKDGGSSFGFLMSRKKRKGIKLQSI